MNIFVGNLPKTATEDDLKRAFDGYGNILKTVIAKDSDTGVSLGYGHVYIVPEPAARAAIADLNRGIIKGNMISIRECIYRERDQLQAEPKSKRRQTDTQLDDTVFGMVSLAR